MIEICTAVTDPTEKYVKYVAAMMVSVWSHTDTPCRFHVLTDETLSASVREQLRQIGLAYHGEVAFYDVELPSFAVEQEALARFSKATLYRLMISDVLPKDLQRLIYLDADIICNLDIRELWEEDLGDASLGGISDPFANGVGAYHNILLGKGILHKGEYINAGVLLLDLEKIRRGQPLLSVCIRFFEAYPDAEWFDQDAINYLFRGAIQYLSHRYNEYTVYVRARENEEPCIFHFAGDTPRDPALSKCDRLFLEMLKKTPWGSDAFIEQQRAKHWALAEREKEIIRKLLVTLTAHPDRPRAFWGARGPIHQEVLSCFALRDQDVIIDNATNIQGGETSPLPIVSPAWLEDRKGKVIVIAAIYRYAEVKKQMEAMGLKEYEDFFPGHILVRRSAVQEKVGNRFSVWDL